MSRETTFTVFLLVPELNFSSYKTIRLFRYCLPLVNPLCMFVVTIFSFTCLEVTSRWISLTAFPGTAQPAVPRILLLAFLFVCFRFLTWASHSPFFSHQGPLLVATAFQRQQKKQLCTDISHPFSILVWSNGHSFTDTFYMKGKLVKNTTDTVGHTLTSQ